MLFWAVDNPAPANYLLISGDRDFSNALHQLRMRRYNILLAQPQKASAPLIAAAKSVWLWTSLSAGGPPLSNVESAQFVRNGYGYSSVYDSLPNEFAQATQPPDSFHGNTYVDSQKFSSMGRGADLKHKGKQTRRNFNQPSMPRTSNTMNGFKEEYTNGNFQQPAYGYSKQFNEAHGSTGTFDSKVATGGSGPTMVPGIPESLLNNSSHHHDTLQNHYPQSVRENAHSVGSASMPVSSPSTNQHPYPSTGMPHRPEPQSMTIGPPTYVPDIGNLNIREYPRHDRSSPTSRPQSAGERRQSSTESPDHVSFSSPQKSFNAQKRSFGQEVHTKRFTHGNQEIPPPLSSISGAATIPVSNVGLKPVCPEPSKYEQGLTGIILLALNSLRNDKIVPTEENITDCIRYGDPKHRNTDVKKALACALQQQLVVKQLLGTLQLYVGKNERLWQCVNPMAGNIKQYTKSTWDEIQKFLSSSAGRSAIVDTECR